MRQTAQKPYDGFNLHEVELAQGDLRLALAFAAYSSAAYERGKLKRAIDARSRAHSLCVKAIARLTGSPPPA